MTLHIGFLVTGIAIVLGVAVIVVRRLRNRADRSRQKYIDALWGTAAAIVFGGIFIVAGLFRPIPAAAVWTIFIGVGLALAGILALWILGLRDERSARQRDLALGVPTRPKPAGFWAVFLPVAFLSGIALTLAVLPYVFLSTLDDTNGQSLLPADGRMSIAVPGALTVAAVRGVRHRLLRGSRRTPTPERLRESLQ